MAHKILEVLTEILNYNNTRDIDAEWARVLLAACHAVRALCVHDDYRKDMSSAYENGKNFMAADMMNFLLFYSKKFQEYPSLAAAALSAAKQLITTEDREVGDVDRKVRHCVVYALLHFHCSALVICC